MGLWPQLPHSQSVSVYAAKPSFEESDTIGDTNQPWGMADLPLNMEVNFFHHSISACTSEHNLTHLDLLELAILHASYIRLQKVLPPLTMVAQCERIPASFSICFFEADFLPVNSCNILFNSFYITTRQEGATPS